MCWGVGEVKGDVGKSGGGEGRVVGGVGKCVGVWGSIEMWKSVLGCGGDVEKCWGR